MPLLAVISPRMHKNGYLLDLDEIADIGIRLFDASFRSNGVRNFGDLVAFWVICCRNVTRSCEL